MAKRMLLECDGCGTARGVTQITGKKDAVPFTVDLCDKCWKQLSEDWHFQVGSRASRKEFVVYSDIKDIPK